MIYSGLRMRSGRIMKYSKLLVFLPFFSFFFLFPLRYRIKRLADSYLYSFQKVEEQARQNIATCSQRLYPNLPSPPIPATLPLEAYRGHYSHPGYGDLFIGPLDELTVSTSGFSGFPPAEREAKEEGSLYLWRSPEAADQLLGRLEHKTAEYWLTYLSVLGLPEAVKYCARTEFRVGVDGQVTSVGVNVRMETEDSPLVWFERL